MLRRTLILFVSFVLLVLAMTVGYAMLGLSGPRTAIADADRAIAAGRIADGVRMLDIAERTLTAAEQEELLPAILRRRFAAHRKLGNVPAARRDLEQLLDLLRGGPPDDELAVQHLEILLAADEPDAALRVAQAELARPDHTLRARLLEITGEAQQAIYQRTIARLMKSLDQSLGIDARRRAVAWLKVMLYRPADDPIAQHAEGCLRDLLREQAATPLSFDTLQRAVSDVRAGVLQASAAFWECFESEGAEPDAAYRGLAFALKSAGRHDELRVLTELYTRRFDHPATVQAVVAAVEAHVAKGEHAEAVRLAQRYLPLGSAKARVEADRFPPACKRLLVAEGQALFALHDQASLDRRASEAYEVHQTERLSILPELFLLNAYSHWNHGNDSSAEQLDSVLRMAGTTLPRSADDPDLGALAFDLKQRFWRTKGKTAEVDATLDAWCKARPADLRARRLRCDHLLATDRPDRAVADAAELLKDRSRDEATLELYVRAVDQAAVSADRDAAQLLARLAVRGAAGLTEPHDPAIYLALGELALRRGQPAVAARCGQLAARHFTWAEWPRRLEVEARLQLDPPGEALRAAETYREFHPTSTTALQLYRQALVKVDRREPELLFDVARHGLADVDLARTLLASAIARDQRSLLPALCRRTMYRYGRDAQVTLRAALGMLVANQNDAARDLLLRIPVSFPNDHEACVEAATRFLLLEAKAAPKSPMLGMAVQVLCTHARGAEPLVRAATELEEAGQPALVLAVLAPILEDDAHAQARSGVVFALAGRASLALDRVAQAEAYLQQAVAFSDASAASSLAMLWTQQDRQADAESALWQREAVDEASACLLLTVGRPESALRWARNRLRESNLDVTAMLVLALQGTADDKRVVPPDFNALARTEGKAVLQAITQLAMPGFQALGEKAARALHERLPGSTIAWFLYARALALVGKRDAAVAELTDLTQKVPGFLPAYDEVLRITDGGLRGDISQIGPRISSSVATAPNLATPRMRAMVGQAFASHLAMVNSNPAAALPVLARLWIQFPQESRAGIENVATLTIGRRSDDAFELLRQLEGQLPATERSRFLEFYFLLGRDLAKAGKPEIEADLYEKARRVVDTEAPFGAAVHFLVDQIEKAHGPFRAGKEGSAHAKEAVALLARHLEFVPTFRDGNPDLALRTLARLEEIEDADQVLVRIDDLLRRDPALLPVWIRRAQLLERRGDIDGALASLRWIFDYVSFEPAILEFARLAGAHDQLDKRDATLLDAEITAELRARPEAAYPLALVAYRRGALDEAAALLEKALPRSDGAHLYLTALVALARPDGADAAEQAFAELVQLYPQSPHAEYARHFAAQLALGTSGKPPAGPK